MSERKPAAGNPQAHISHAGSGRLRIRVPGRRNDVAYFARAEARFGECPGVRRVAVNPLTGSILIEHATDMAAIADFAESGELLSLQPDSEWIPLAVSLRAGVDDLDRWVRRTAGGAMDLWSAMSLVYLTLACIQVVRGHSMGPATALLWTSLSAMRVASERAVADDIS